MASSLLTTKTSMLIWDDGVWGWDWDGVGVGEVGVWDCDKAEVVNIGVLSCEKVGVGDNEVWD